MIVARTVAEAGSCRGAAFVPTMGALHVGHVALIRAARASGLPVALSIFVNPKQFGPSEDFERYPRPLERDFEICRAEKVEMVFVPSVEEMYPPGFATSVSVPSLSACMCGVFRPGHFDGVATVVARLFGIVRPSRAFFGWKDAQQFLIIRRMAEDLALGVELCAIETVRESDGLAVSSRNEYLSPEERARAPELFHALKKGEAAAREGARAGEISSRVKKHLAVQGFDAEYVDLRRLENLEAVDENQTAARASGPLVLAAAARLGKTRLIDNIRFGGGEVRP